MRFDQPPIRNGAYRSPIPLNCLATRCRLAPVRPPQGKQAMSAFSHRPNPPRSRADAASILAAGAAPFEGERYRSAPAARVESPPCRAGCDRTVRVTARPADRLMHFAHEGRRTSARRVDAAAGHRPVASAPALPETGPEVVIVVCHEERIGSAVMTCKGRERLSGHGVEKRATA